MARRISRPVHVVVAWLFVIGLLYQVSLAGMGVFDSSSAFLTHRDTGYTLTVVPVVLAVTGFLGRFGPWQVGAALVMLVQFILQSVFVLQRDSTIRLEMAPLLQARSALRLGPQNERNLALLCSARWRWTSPR